jgi:hypothetical protein
MPPGPYLQPDALIPVIHTQTKGKLMPEIFETTALKFKLPSKRAQEYALNLHQRMREAREREPEHLTTLTAIPEESRTEEILSGWQFDMEADGTAGLYISVSDGENFVDTLAALVQHLLREFDPSGFVQFEWSRTCTDLGPTCFSGGGVHVTADKVYIFTTLDWLEERARNETGRLVNRSYE